MKYQPLFITIIILLLSFSVDAQLFLRLEGSYNFKFLPNELGSGNSISLDQTGISHTVVKHSYGNGIAIGGVVEYSLTEALFLGLGVSYLSGLEGKTTTLGFSSTSTSTKKGNVFRVIPQLNYTFFSYKKWSIRGNLGFILGVDATITEETIIATPGSIDREFSRVKEEGLSFGLQTGLDAIIMLNPKVDLYLGCRLIAQSYSPKSSEVILYLENGEDKLSSLRPFERYAKYVERFVSSPGGGDINEPSISLKKSYSFSSIGITAGVRYKL